MGTQKVDMLKKPLTHIHGKNRLSNYYSKKNIDYYYIMSQFDLMKYKQDQWEHLKDERDKCIIVGRLEMLKDLTEYFNGMRESYTRLLVVNGVEEKEYEELKTMHKNVGCIATDESNHYTKALDENVKIVVDDDGDETSFNNC